MPRPFDLERRFRRAERFLPHNVSRICRNREVVHHWIADSNLLWYKREGARGDEYLIADPENGTVRAAFDHRRMCALLGQAVGGWFEEGRLPISHLEFPNGVDGPVKLRVGEREFVCDLMDLSYAEVPRRQAPGGLPTLRSGRYAVFSRGWDVFALDTENGSERRLTCDGAPQWVYGKIPDSGALTITLQRQGRGVAPAGLFSPDGKKFASYRLDERNVPELMLLQSIPEDRSRRPKPWVYRYPFPGDEGATAKLVVFDLTTGKKTELVYPEMDAQLYGPILGEQITWGCHSDRIYILDHRDDFRELRLVEADIATGEARVLLVERGETNVLAREGPAEPPTIGILSSGDVLWSSERDDWRHLYYYERGGRLRCQLTAGKWVVREILHVDESSQWVFFSGCGRDKNENPYFRHVYRVRFDGSQLERLTPEVADHAVRNPRPALRMINPALPDVSQGGFSSKGDYFVDSHARPDRPTVTVIRDRNGRAALTLETARLTRQIGRRFVPPESFSARAADKRTRIYGTLFKPSGFSETSRYPVIDAVYPGPQQRRASTRFLGDDAQALAELGFIVVTIDGRGTPGRSRSFRDESYGRLETSGSLMDHVSAIVELCKERPYMDIHRVGVYGGSAGGFAAVHALFDYPAFYDVGVAYAGNHDLRSYLSTWQQRYMGPMSPQGLDKACSYANVNRFKGKLLLVHGDMDENVHPANTMRVVDALIRAGKRFDLLILPNVGHSEIPLSSYFWRRVWEFFITHLSTEMEPHTPA